MHTDHSLFRTVLFILFAGLVAGLLWWVFQQVSTTEQGTDILSDTEVSYRFSSFPSGAAYQGGVSSVDYSSLNDAERYREVIDEAVLEGPNFAGKYTIATWSCGASCQLSSVIDARTGSIVEHAIISQYGISYSLDSLLLIVNPPEIIAQREDLGSEVATDYYLLRSGALELVAKELDGSIVESCEGPATEAEHPFIEKKLLFPAPCKVPFGWIEPTVSATSSEPIMQ